MGRLVGEIAIERSERTLGMLNYYWAVVREASSCEGAVSAAVTFTLRSPLVLARNGQQEGPVQMMYYELIRNNFKRYATSLQP